MEREVDLFNVIGRLYVELLGARMMIEEEHEATKNDADAAGSSAAAD